MAKSSAPIHGSQKDAGVPNTGDAAAAVKNRQIRARLQIIKALQRLKIPQGQWPDYVRTFFTNPQERQGYCSTILPPPFEPPVFERLDESPEQWAKAADAAWQKYRDDFLKQCQFWVTAGVDEEIPPMKTTRGPGRKGRNSPPELRANWAALRLIGTPWKLIAGDGFKEDKVKKAATEVLELAGWPPKVKPPTTPKVV